MPSPAASRLRIRLALGALLLACGLLSACASLWPAPQRSLVVTATAYNSVPEQTSGDPFVAAWGDRLRPGQRAIAVSRDLLDEGLVRGTQIRIDGFEGSWVVLDRMASRWRRRIDLYMGTDVAAARRFGVREVTIRWRPRAG